VTKKFNLIEIRVDMGLFDYDVLCVIGNLSECVKYVADVFEDNSIDDDWSEEVNRGYEPRGRCYHRAGYVPIIWIPKVPKTAREYATLSHECMHAVFHLFEWAAVPIDRSTEEVFGHSLAHLVTNIIQEARQKQRSLRQKPEQKQLTLDSVIAKP